MESAEVKIHICQVCQDEIATGLDARGFPKPCKTCKKSRRVHSKARRTRASKSRKEAPRPRAVTLETGLTSSPKEADMAVPILELYSDSRQRIQAIDIALQRANTSLKSLLVLPSKQPTTKHSRPSGPWNSSCTIWNADVVSNGRPSNTAGTQDRILSP